MSDRMNVINMKNGMTGYVYCCDYEENPITDWDNVAEINIWSRRHMSYAQSSFFNENSIPSPEEIYDAVEIALDEVGRNASGEAFANAVGYDNVITWDVYAESRDDGNSMSTAGYRLLSRAVKWLWKKYWWSSIARYEHGNVYYSTGGTTCRFDSGYCGIAVVDRALHKEDLKTPCKDGSINPDRRAEEYTDDLLQCYSQACNGEVYGWAVENAVGDSVDSCGGYYDWGGVVDELNTAVAYWENKADSTILYRVGNRHRVRALNAMYNKFGNARCELMLDKLRVNVYFDKKLQQSYLCTESHNDISAIATVLLDDVPTVGAHASLLGKLGDDEREFCRAYGEAYIESVLNEKFSSAN